MEILQLRATDGTDFKIPGKPRSIRVHLSQICVIYAKVVAAFAEAGGSFLEVPSLFNPDSLVLYLVCWPDEGALRRTFWRFIYAHPQPTGIGSHT